MSECRGFAVLKGDNRARQERNNRARLDEIYSSDELDSKSCLVLEEKPWLSAFGLFFGFASPDGAAADR